jgi:hypothetical protein
MRQNGSSEIKIDKPPNAHATTASKTIGNGSSKPGANDTTNGVYEKSKSPEEMKVLPHAQMEKMMEVPSPRLSPLTKRSL